MTAELHTLTGAYAVHALPEDERRRFEEHRAACLACRREVAEFQATASLLGELLERTPPPPMRPWVLAAIDQTRQESPVGRRVAAHVGHLDAAPEYPIDPASDDPVGAAPGVPGGPVDAAPGAPGGPVGSAPGGPVGPDSGRPAQPDELVARRTPAPWWSSLLAPAAAVVAVIVLGLSLLVANLSDRIGEAETAATATMEVLTSPDAGAVTVDGPEGSFARVVMSESMGQAVFLAEGMGPAPDGHTYELWLIDGDQASSMGRFDVDDTGRATRLVRGDLQRAGAIGVTVEPTGGSPEPTTEPVMLIEFDDA